MKNLFATLLNKKTTRDDLVACMQRDKDSYIAMFNNLARYEGQQQKLSQGVMAMEKFLLSTEGGTEEDPEELLWTARIASFQFLRAFLNQAAKERNFFRGVDPANAVLSMAAFTNGALDLLIEDPEVALGWLSTTAVGRLATLADIDTSDLNYATI